MNKAATELLKAHQAIIDAWFDKWLKEQRRRIDAVWKRKK